MRLRTLFILTLLIPASAAFAQQQRGDAKIGYIYPAGGQQGSTFHIIVGGQQLDQVDGVYISGDGVTAKIVDHFKPLPPGQASLARDRLRELQDKRIASRRPAPPASATQPSTRPVFTAADEEEVTQLVKKLANFVRKPSSPAIAESVTLEVQLSPNANPGRRELRLCTPIRRSNPMVFQIGELPEVAEEPSRIREEVTRSVGRKEMNVKTPVLVNGQILPGGVNAYHFRAHRGENLVIAVSGRSLIPYIADAVPGWFQPVVTLYDPRGQEVECDDHFRFNPDPILHYVPAIDGDYTVEIHDSIYRGREDFVYRMAIGDLPFVTSIFPLGGPAGAQTNVELKGWNLPQVRTVMDATTRPAGCYSLPMAHTAVNAPMFAVDTLPELAETEPNDLQTAAMPVPTSAIINGRIDKPGDVDFFKFEGQAGQEIVAEVLARRLGSPLDSVLRLYDSSGKQLAENDDTEDRAQGLLTHHADSRISLKLPSTGTYFLQLADTQAKGGAEYAYRLRLSEPRPDFELRVAPSSVSLRRWNNEPVTVHLLRRDGFTGAVSLSLADMPAGWKLSETNIPPDKDLLKLSIITPPAQAEGTYPIHLQGMALINGTQRVQEATPAEDMMQAFAYRQLVPSEAFFGTIGHPAPRNDLAEIRRLAARRATTRPANK